MKSLWVATGVIVGLGVAGIVAATMGNGRPPSKIIGGDTVVDVDGSTTTSPTTTVVGSEASSTTEVTSTTAVGIVPVVNLPPAGGTPPPSPSPSTSPASATTGVPTTLPFWHNVGDVCSSDGAIGVSGSGEALVCSGGSWQRS